MYTKKGQPGRRRENARRVSLGLKPIWDESPLKHKHVAERKAKEAELGKTANQIFQEQYARLQQYRLSPEWREKRRLVLDRDGECQVCGRIEGLEVHHLTYENACDEPLHHLVAVCTGCHHAIHYDKNGRRRRDWKKYNPPPVLPEGEKDA
jgi:5-methylcytosine-specific restriction endonuclease McrA